MQQTFSRLILCIVLLSSSVILKAQKVEKYAFDLFLGGHSTTFSYLPSDQLDFMNYVNAYEEYLVDEAYLGLSTHLWLRNHWEIDFKMAVESDLVPVIFDLRFTKLLGTGFGLNLGLENRPFFINNVEMHYSNLAEIYTINGHSSLSYNYFQFNLFLYGPYAGINYMHTWKWVRFQAAVNGGVFFNNKNKLEVILKEKNGNYLWAEEYALRSSPGPWITPELKLAFKLFESESLQFGLRTGASFFISRKALNYDYTRREWTYHNSETNFKQMPAHWLKQAGVDFGLYILKK